MSVKLQNYAKSNKNIINCNWIQCFEIISKSLNLERNTEDQFLNFRLVEFRWLASSAFNINTPTTQIM